MTDRYTALGLPYPDPSTMCKGQCEGTGMYPVAVYLHPPNDGEVRSVDPEPLTPYELTEWHKAEAANPNRPGDAYHFIRCQECDGSGKRSVERDPSL